MAAVMMPSSSLFVERGEVSAAVMAAHTNFTGGLDIISHAHNELAKRLEEGLKRLESLSTSSKDFESRVHHIEQRQTTLSSESQASLNKTVLLVTQRMDSLNQGFDKGNEELKRDVWLHVETSVAAADERRRQGVKAAEEAMDVRLMEMEAAFKAREQKREEEVDAVHARMRADNANRVDSLAAILREQECQAKENLLRVSDAEARLLRYKEEIERVHGALDEVRGDALKGTNDINRLDQLLEDKMSLSSTQQEMQVKLQGLLALQEERLREGVNERQALSARHTELDRRLETEHRERSKFNERVAGRLEGLQTDISNARDWLGHRLESRIDAAVTQRLNAISSTQAANGTKASSGQDSFLQGSGMNLPPRPAYRNESGEVLPILSEPHKDARVTGEAIQPGDVFFISEEQQGSDGASRYLRLANGKGWVLSRSLDGTPMCVRQDITAWRCEPFDGHAMSILSGPELNAVRSGHVLDHGEDFLVCEERLGVEDSSTGLAVTHLRLADGRGWVFDRFPSQGVMCTRRPTPAWAIDFGAAAELRGALTAATGDCKVAAKLAQCLEGMQQQQARGEQTAAQVSREARALDAKAASLSELESRMTDLWFEMQRLTETHLCAATTQQCLSCGVPVTAHSKSGFRGRSPSPPHPSASSEDSVGKIAPLPPAEKAMPPLGGKQVGAQQVLSQIAASMRRPSGWSQASTALTTPATSRPGSAHTPSTVATEAMPAHWQAAAAGGGLAAARSGTSRPRSSRPMSARARADTAR